MKTAKHHTKRSKLMLLACIALAAVLLRVSLGPLGPILLASIVPSCLLGLVASAAIAGPRSALAGLRFLTGRATTIEYPMAAHALATGGQFLIHLGVASSFIALLSNLDLIRLVWDSLQNGTQHPNIGPADIARTVQYGILIGVPAALIAGRFVLGAAGELAASRSGIPRPTFPFAPQFAALLVVPAQFAMIVIPFPTITH